jgi:arsenate reductase
MTEIWHNPRCSKSRQTLALLEERGITPVVRLYLDDAPDATTLREVAQKLGKTAVEMMRVKESLFKELGLSKSNSDETLFKAMAENPKLIERPVVLHNGKAAMGRPPEAVLDIL